MQYDHPTQTVGRQYPKAWVIGKTLGEMEAAFEYDDRKRARTLTVVRK